MFSEGDASYFIMTLQEHHTTMGLNDEETVAIALSRLQGPAKEWATDLSEEVKNSAESFMLALAQEWPPKTIIPCENLRNMKQETNQTVDEFITQISFRAMQHVLLRCQCCELYSALDDQHDRLNTMVYDILVKGASEELMPFLHMCLRGLERFSSSKRLLRAAASKAEALQTQQYLSRNSVICEKETASINTDVVKHKESFEYFNNWMETIQESHTTRVTKQTNSRSCLAIAILVIGILFLLFGTVAYFTFRVVNTSLRS